MSDCLKYNKASPCCSHCKYLSELVSVCRERLEKESRERLILIQMLRKFELTDEDVAYIKGLAK